MSSFVKQLAKGSFWMVLSSVITRLSGLIALPFLARLLGPSNLGLYNLLQSTLQTSDVLSKLGADAAMHRYGSQYKTIGAESVGRLFTVGSCIILFSSGSISIFLWIGREMIAREFLGNTSIEKWLVLAALAAFISAIGNLCWVYLVALHEFQVYSLRSSALTISGSIITVVLAWIFGVNGALVSFLVMAFFQTAWSWWLTLPVLNKHDIRLKYDNFIPEVIKIFKFGLPFYSSNFISGFVGLPLMGYLTKSGGIEQLGYLRVAQTLSQFISFLPTAVAPLLVSGLSASIDANKADYHRIKSLHLRTIWCFLLLISIVISFNLDWMVSILFGASYRDSVVLTRITIWIAVFNSLSSMMTQYVLSLGNTRVIALIQTTSLVVLVVIAVLLIPEYKSLGLLIAQSISGLFTLIAYAKPALGDINKSDHKFLWLLTFASINLFLLSFVPSIVNLGTFVNIIVSIVFFVMTLTLTFLGCFTEQERLQLRSSVLSITSKFK